MTAAEALARFAWRLRLERSARYWLLGLGGGTLVAGLLQSWLPLVIGALLGIAVAFAADRFRRIVPRDVALHLDRALPELEESATLILEPAATGLAALQRDLVLHRWDAAAVRASIPHRELRQALLLSLPLAAIGAVLALRGPAPRLDRGAADSALDTGTLAVRSLVADIVPPGYTGAGRRRVASDDVAAEEGSRITWRAEIGGGVRAAWLAGSSGDSFPLRKEGGYRWRVEMRAARSQLFRVVALGGDTARATSADVRLAVKPDRPPVLTIVAPVERTEIEPAAIAPVPVEVLATDDYGVDSAGLGVTIATGRGEATRFRRLRLSFTARERAGAQGTRLRATLDLPGLGLGPGDELYFVAEVTDRREPVPNRSHSGTVFLSVRDTSRAPAADLAPMALGVQPEYFRSQRQIIIDTEKLLADSARLTPTRFRERANDLGIDQGLLRLRYGQFLGEEFEGESSDVGEVHAHDDAENATLLGQTVKDKLRVALGAMWQAELQLRTAQPRLALPHEHRALEMIKQVQQDSRVYVQRIGFEPPPIEVGKIRLTGRLEGLAGQRRSASGTARDTLPAIRAALQALAVPHTEAQRPTLIPMLEAAGNELAGLAGDAPAQLGTVRELRRYLAALQADAGCTSCRERVLRGLYAALPPPLPGVGAGRGPESVVGARFRRLLDAGRQ